MTGNKQLTQLLNISSLLVLGIYEEDRQIILTTEHRHKQAVCNRCGTLSSKTFPSYHRPKILILEPYRFGVCSRHFCSPIRL